MNLTLIVYTTTTKISEAKQHPAILPYPMERQTGQNWCSKIHFDNSVIDVDLSVIDVDVLVIDVDSSVINANVIKLCSVKDCQWLEALRSHAWSQDSF